MEQPENLQVIKIEPPLTPEKANIKERLNLHVKRRLQQDAPGSSSGTEMTVCEVASKRSKVSQNKDSPKPRKPYQKRLDKCKTESNKCKKAPVSAAELESLDDTQDFEATASPEALETKSINRERCKTDILNMVLSVKKRALLQDPEVQAFWHKIMCAIKS